MSVRRPPTSRSRSAGWQRIAQVLLVVTMVGATAGVLGIVIQNSVLLGRMTTDVSVAQQRTTNLHNLQRETLRLVQQLTELGRAATSRRSPSAAAC